MRLIMPKEGENTPVAESKTLTFLFDKQKMYAYKGSWEKALAENKIHETDFHFQKGMGSLIRNKQAVLSAKDDLVVVLKPVLSASYQQVLAALDEMQINLVTQYAVVDASDNEVTFMQKQ